MREAVPSAGLCRAECLDNVLHEVLRTLSVLHLFQSQRDGDFTRRDFTGRRGTVGDLRCRLATVKILVRGPQAVVNHMLCYFR